MRPAVQHATVTRRATPSAPPTGSRSGGLEPGIKGETATDAAAEQSKRLTLAIIQRIESRLPGRVRNLAVRIRDDSVVLEGQCATYYTKQLAQHAALGILEDEHLENAIVVAVGR